MKILSSLKIWLKTQGWWHLLVALDRAITEQNLSYVAAAVAFYLFLSIPSLLTALISLYGLVLDSHDVGVQIQSLRHILPRDVIALLLDQLKQITTTSPVTLGLGLCVSLLIALWSGRSAALAFMNALTVASGLRETRGFFELQLSALALTLGAVLFAIGSVLLVAILPAIFHILPLGPLAEFGADVFRWAVLVLLLGILLALLYRLAPAKRIACHWFNPGTVVATFFWIIASALLSFYVGHVASYNQTYGSTSAVVVTLLWLYVTAFVILCGAELNIILVRRREGAGALRHGLPERDGPSRHSPPAGYPEPATERSMIPKAIETAPDRATPPAQKTLA